MLKRDSPTLASGFVNLLQTCKKNLEDALCQILTSFGGTQERDYKVSPRKTS